MSAAAEWTASPVIAALEHVWSRIRDRHADLPAAVLVVASGSELSTSRRLGHWGAGRWHVDAAGTRVGEVFLAGEALKAGAPEVLHVLLHEAAHAIAFARGIQDCSRGGRYHNARYLELSELVGLSNAKHASYGWTITALTPATAIEYGVELAELAAAIGGAHRRAVDEVDAPADGAEVEGGDEGGDELEPEPKPTAGKRWRLACACPAPRLLRVSASVALPAPITCGACGGVFVGDELVDALRALDVLPAPWASCADLLGIEVENDED